MTKAVTELLAGNTAKERLDLHRNEPVSDRAKNKKSLSRTAASKNAYLLCLDAVRTPVSEGYLPSVLRCSNLGQTALSRECLNQQGIPESQLLSLAGTMCEMCGFLRLWLLFFLLSVFLSLPLLFFSRHGWVMAGGSRVWGGEAL